MGPPHHAYHLDTPSPRLAHTALCMSDHVLAFWAYKGARATSMSADNGRAAHSSKCKRYKTPSLSSPSLFALAAQQKETDVASGARRTELKQGADYYLSTSARSASHPDHHMVLPTVLNYENRSFKYYGVAHRRRTSHVRPRARGEEGSGVEWPCVVRLAPSHSMGSLKP